MRILLTLTFLFLSFACQNAFALTYTSVTAKAHAYAPYPNSINDEATIVDADSAAVSASAFVSQEDTQWQVQDDSATASASFNLSKGEVKFDLYATGYGADSFVSISIYDEIFPQWDVPSSDPIDVTLSWNMEGTYSVSSGSPFNLGIYTTAVAEIDTTHEYDFTWPNYDTRNLTDGSESWSKTLSFDPSTSDHIGFFISVGGWLDTYTTQWANADFSHTGLFDIVLSEGASFTSSSGVLLTDVNGIPDPVPEPATIILLGSGLAGLAFYRRKRK